MEAKAKSLFNVDSVLFIVYVCGEQDNAHSTFEVLIYDVKA